MEFVRRDHAPNIYENILVTSLRTFVASVHKLQKKGSFESRKVKSIQCSTYLMYLQSIHAENERVIMRELEVAGEE